MPRFYSQPLHRGFSCMSDPLHQYRHEFLADKYLLASDIAYYGINLNQSLILSQIGYADGPTPWATLRNTAVGNIIVQAAVRNFQFSVLLTHGMI